MSVGFLLNFFLPMKLGEFVRAILSGKSMKNGMPLSFATVAVDRYLDIIVVGLIFAVLAAIQPSGSNISSTAFFYIFLAAGVAALTGICVALKRYLKLGIQIVARLFNHRIELAILQFFWALIWCFKNILIRISKVKLLLTTILMWCGYLLSYSAFASFFELKDTTVSWVDLFVTLFSENSVLSSTQNAAAPTGLSLISFSGYMAVYMLLPPLLLLLLSLFIPKEDMVLNKAEEERYIHLLPHLDKREQREFLELYFSDSNRAYISNYLTINQNISIIRDYSAGSNATTMLCMDGNRMFFRKYAFGKDGDKLYEQIQWITGYQKLLPLPDVMKQEKNEFFCYYDMPYLSNTVSLFDYVHSMPVDMSSTIIQRVLERLEKTIYRINNRKADTETIHLYYESKVRKNLDRIKAGKQIRDLQQYNTVIINGVEYPNINQYEKYLTEHYLAEVFQNDIYAVIHGDLTIENIICIRDLSGQDDFYIIDPNPGNIHDSPNLDYGKLLQSIHGGYEFLMAQKKVSVEENRIDFLFTKSFAYEELHRRLNTYMRKNLGEERTRSIYFHEMIHWLRLMPYKIEKDEQRALLFYAGMLMVMKSVIDMYGKE